MQVHYCSAQELRNAALPLQNLLYLVHLHEARKGPRLPKIRERRMVNFVQLRAGITRKLNHTTPAYIDQMLMRDYLRNTTLEVCFWSVLCLLNHLLCSFLTTHLLFSSSKIRIAKTNVFVTSQILIQKYGLLTFKPMQTTCTAHQTLLLNNHQKKCTFKTEVKH